ncbi:hypothetical protein E2C01_101824 [Portunus trituberculatus]|uniref:Uncharacterized protein n=1 Tax=Portunus trituberculatus TaxID=210409 RepID=A0A5B7KMV0_PORTR|nr:hypothetical protein [Portunus trituberculatus]
MNMETRHGTEEVKGDEEMLPSIPNTALVGGVE